MKRNGTVSLMKAVRRAVVERPDRLPVAPQELLLNRVESFDVLTQNLVRQVGGIPGDEQQLPPALPSSWKPALVHEADLTKEVCTRGFTDRLGAIGPVEGELARDGVSIHADDERIGAGSPCNLVGDRSDITSELAPADGHELRMPAVSDARNAARQIKKARSVKQQHRDHRGRPGSGNRSARAMQRLHDARRKHRQ